MKSGLELFQSSPNITAADFGLSCEAPVYLSLKQQGGSSKYIADSVDESSKGGVPSLSIFARPAICKGKEGLPFSLVFVLLSLW